MPFDGTEGVPAAARQARQLLVGRGWCKGITEDPAGRLCLFGAVREATHGHDGNTIYLALFARVTTLIGNNMSRWNDAPERTLDEVLDLLDQAAAE